KPRGLHFLQHATPFHSQVERNCRLIKEFCCMIPFLQEVANTMLIKLNEKFSCILDHLSETPNFRLIIGIKVVSQKLRIHFQYNLHDSELSGLNQDSSNGQSLCNFDLTVTQVPQKINWEDKIVKGSNDWILQTAVSKLFEERPIWPKRTLQERLADDGLKITYDHLKRLLFRTAYYFGCGPYRTLWIRNGYDARKDPESRIYQRVDFRIPKPLRDSINANSKNGEKVLWKDICAFRVVPHKKFSSLQLYDLQDDYIQEQIRKPPERTTCRQSTGWFSRSTFDRLRLHVRVRFLSLLPSDAAKTLVQSEAKILERCKRRAGLEETRRESDSDGLEHVDIGLISTDAENIAHNANHESQKCHEEDDDEKDEVDDDEGEEEEEEEEMDDYDYPPPETQGFGSASSGRDS
ncbi:hypothetical protein KI387_009177, partial [Taxus chinensis]